MDHARDTGWGARQRLVLLRRVGIGFFTGGTHRAGLIPDASMVKLSKEYMKVRDLAIRMACGEN